ncbi:unnamed protein product [Moneuplotes crassus]|uniref:Nuclear transcription factor Y subunit n=1 Tax=Euplotes crassus TaxID=5936 RepID=A0AAD1URR2_EUPCR|nr:unnamed protein product [Moneuplotes crassus]
MFSPKIAFQFDNLKEGAKESEPSNIYNAHTGDKSTRSMDVKENPTKNVTKDPKIQGGYAFIDSVFPGQDKIKVREAHLARIMKRRAARAKDSFAKLSHVTHRARTEGPMHGSRSRFAKQRPRDPNGRFYTKYEIEKLRQQDYIQAVVAYLQSQTVPGQSAEAVKSQSYKEVLKSFPERVFKITKAPKIA